jgi:hypothetical protein
MAASIALAAAVVATFAIGAHRNMPSRRVKMTRVFPGVSSNAIERGCAAWRESVETCVSGGAAPDAEFTWPER